MEIGSQFTGQSMALVLGGSSGLGLASVKKLASHGIPVLAWFRERRAREETLLAEFQSQYPTLILPFNGDITKAEVRNQVWNSCQAAGIQFHVLLHSIARGSPGTLNPNTHQKPLTALDFNLTYDAMALNWFYVLQELIQNKLPAKNMCNLAFSSRGGHRVLPGYAAIGMAKSALETLGKYMAVEFAASGIRTNVLEIGITDTPALSVLPNSKILLEHVAQNHPLGRGTQAEDAANVVYLMCQPEARWINGAVIPVDGGESLI
jgi:enoyl-[acyl-carrier protein] reductase III